jgi:hypothetical protein
MNEFSDGLCVATNGKIITAKPAFHAERGKAIAPDASKRELRRLRAELAQRLGCDQIARGLAGNGN